jgi:hypothetical protein
MPEPKVNPSDLEAVLDASGVGERTKKKIRQANAAAKEASKRVVGQGSDERPQIVEI